MNERGTPLLEMRGIVKSFPGVRALTGVDVCLYPGEVHALVGENGAGKSTLMRILAGAILPDSGEILLDSAPIRITSPREAERYGIGMVTQELGLIPMLSATANIVLGREAMRGPFIDHHANHHDAARILAELDPSVPLERPVERLSLAQQQLVEIAKVIGREARIIVLDEPTATLSEPEINALFARIEHLKAHGTAFVYISHRMEELSRIADRVTVLRDGHSILTEKTVDIAPDALVTAMVGRAIEQRFPDLPASVHDTSPVALRVEHLQTPRLDDISFTLRRGEILGIAGLVGSGRTEVLRAIAGADPFHGTIRVGEKPLRSGSPRQAIANGIAFLTEDRKGQGLVLEMSVGENTTLAHLHRFLHGIFVDRRAEERSAQRFATDLRIRMHSLRQRVRTLSGGNQQKVLLARWLLGKADIFLFDEPTRGIDVGAKAEIYSLLTALARDGAAILLVSSELPEVLALSHRLLVLREGRVVDEMLRDDFSAERVIAAATGIPS